MTQLVLAQLIVAIQERRAHVHMFHPLGDLLVDRRHVLRLFVLELARETTIAPQSGQSHPQGAFSTSDADATLLDCSATLSHREAINGLRKLAMAKDLFLAQELGDPVRELSAVDGRPSLLIYSSDPLLEKRFHGRCLS